MKIVTLLSVTSVLSLNFVHLIKKNHKQSLLSKTKLKRSETNHN